MEVTGRREGVQVNKNELCQGEDRNGENDNTVVRATENYGGLLEGFSTSKVILYLEQPLPQD